MGVREEGREERGGLEGTRPTHPLISVTDTAHIGFETRLRWPWSEKKIVHGWFSHWLHILLDAVNEQMSNELKFKVPC